MESEAAESLLSAAESAALAVRWHAAVLVAHWHAEDVHQAIPGQDAHHSADRNQDQLAVCLGQTLDPLVDPVPLVARFRAVTESEALLSQEA